MMNTMRGFFNPNHLDQSSRANDVIVVRHRDGSLHSTPFNVRFGKAQIWNSNDKVVQVEVNGDLTAAFMKIGEGGEAYWLQPTYARLSQDQPKDDSAALAGLGGSEFNLNDDFPVRPESPVDLWEAQAHPITAELAAHATVLDETQRTTDEDALALSGTNNSPLTDTQPGRGAGNTSDHTEEETPLLQGDDQGRYKVVREAIHNAGDAQAANLALQAMAAADKAERRLSSRMPADPYLKEQALNEFPAAASAAPAQTKPLTATTKPTHAKPEAPTAAVVITPTSTSRTPATAGAGGVVPVLSAPLSAPEGSALAVEIAAAEGSSADEPLDLNASQRDQDDEMIDGGGDEYYLEPLDIEDYVDLYGEDDLLENTSFTSADADTFAPKKGTGTKPAPKAAAAAKSTKATGTNGPASTKVGTPSSHSAAGSNVAAEKPVGHPENPYFTRTLLPVQADLVKLNLKDGCNHVRYLTRKSPTSEDVVAITCNIFLWDYRDRIVVSDVDGTITKSDLWGHFYSMLGKGGDWTHPGICSLYSKIHSNGYRMVYLTARSVTQIHQTKEYLWTLEQDGARLPLGPVLTVPQKFFTALTQEVSKRSHIFKIACLTSLKAAFPPHAKPFFAGFGNRYNDVLSYDAVGVAQHKIFIIDPSSVLHVARVKQSYPNLAKLVDVTFPPVRHHLAPRTQRPGQPAGAGSGAASTVSGGSVYGSSDDDEEMYTQSTGSQDEIGEGPLAPSMSAAFAMVGNDLSRAKLNPDVRDEYHILAPGGGPGSPVADSASTRATVPGAAQPLTAAQAKAADGLQLTSGTVLAGKVSPSTQASSAARASASPKGSTLARGVVVQGGISQPTKPTTTKGLFVRPASEHFTTNNTALPVHTSSSPAGAHSSNVMGSPLGDDLEVDSDFSAYNFWRVDPRDLVEPPKAGGGGADAAKGQTKASPATVVSKTSRTPTVTGVVLSGTESTPRPNVAATGPTLSRARPASSTAVASATSPGGAPSNVYSPTSVRGAAASVSAPPTIAGASTGATTVRVAADDSEEAKKTKKTTSSGGGLFSFGFGRNSGPSAEAKKQAATEAAALAAAKTRSHMHPDSLDYYFANTTATAAPSSGSGAAAARSLAESARQLSENEASLAGPGSSPLKARTASATVEQPAANASKQAAPASARSTSPSSWAFWRRSNATGSSSNNSSRAEAKPAQAPPLVASSTTVDVADPSATSAPVTPPEKPANAAEPAKLKRVNLDDLFEV